jgi:hypothetical protein
VPVCSIPRLLLLIRAKLAKPSRVLLIEISIQSKKLADSTSGDMPIQPIAPMVAGDFKLVLDLDGGFCKRLVTKVHVKQVKE